MNKHTKKCPECGKIQEYASKDSLHNAEANNTVCQNCARQKQKKSVTISCRNCEAEFDVLPSRSDRKFCCRECFYQHNKGKTSSEVVLICDNCGSETRKIESEVSDNNFCDRECYLEWHSVEPEEKTCENCGNIFEAEENRKFCCRQCYKESYNPDDINKGECYASGYYKSVKSGDKMWFDSSYELRRMKQLDASDSVKKWERCSVRVPYTFEDEKYGYYPDIRVEYDNRTVVEEVKGFIGDRDRAKISAAKSFFENSDEVDNFMVLQREDIFDVKDGVVPIFERYENKYGEFHRQAWHTIRMKMAVEIRKRSTCLRNKVGAIIVPKNQHNVYVFGYNGSEPGAVNGCSSLEPGNCGCIHAEENALRKLDEYHPDVERDLIMYITLLPCEMCADKIVEYPISKIVYRSEYRNSKSKEIFEDAGITVTKYSDLLDTHNEEFINS